MDKDRSNDVRDAVRRNYARVARQAGSGGCCGDAGREGASDCCAEGATPTERLVQQLGYSLEELSQVPPEAFMGLGCGNPQAIAGLRPGETVLDLGSGGGLDCFLAAGQVSAAGSVIGVDMTPEMVSRARENARQGDYTNVEFRLGEIERLPVADDCVDVIISNCVTNLSPDKPAVFREAFRVLKAGGRLAINDIVATASLPHEVRSNPALWSGCIGGAETIQDVESWLREAGFESIRIQPQDESREFIREWAPGRSVEEYIVSATIEATKPGS